MTAIAMLQGYAPLLASALGTTLRICALAILMAMPIGLLLALGLRSANIALKSAARAYVEIMRGTPILVILFLLYYGGPSVGVALTAELVGIVGLGAYGAGYFAEIFRAGLKSIAHGQIEAAQMLGLSRRHIVIRIQVWQMARLVIPPSVNQSIVLIKESAALSIITVPEIAKAGAQIANETFAVVTPYLATALLYWALVEAVSVSGRLLERWITRAH